MTHEPTGGVLDAWKDTWFGDPGSWPSAHVAAAERCLSLVVPSAVTWGPDFRLLYNHAYAELIGEQHPGVRGRPAWEVASAMWPVVGPMLHAVRTDGETLSGDRVPLARETPSGLRTDWYSWTYSPVWCDGRVEGVFAVVHDETAVELAAHHHEVLSCAGRVASAADVHSALRELVTVLGAMPDARFAVCHLLEHGGSWSRLAHAGPDLRQPVAASLLDHAERTGRWPSGPLPDIDRFDPRVIRSPDGTVRRGLGASWSVAAPIHQVVVAVTVGFAPLVGESGDHRPFMEKLSQRLSSGTE